MKTVSNNLNLTVIIVGTFLQKNILLKSNLDFSILTKLLLRDIRKQMS